MTKRAHSEMIIEWAKNDKLVVFSKYYWGWEDVTGSPSWCEDRKYFLCQPKHKDAVLTLLNGGEVECRDLNGRDWYECDLGNSVEWKSSSWYWYMNDKIESRVKLKKQTRYAYVHETGYIGKSFETKEDLIAYFGSGYKEGRIIKFNIEV